MSYESELPVLPNGSPFLQTLCYSSFASSSVQSFQFLSLDKLPMKISYELHGRGPIRVCLIHGEHLPGKAWHGLVSHFISPLAGNKYTVLTFDNRGTGLSSNPKDIVWTIEDMSSDVFSLLNHLGWTQNVHLVGFSLGGYITQRLLRKDKRWSSVSFLACSPSPSTRDMSWYSVWYYFKADHYRNARNVPKFIEYIVKANFSPSWHENDEKNDAAKRYFRQMIDLDLVSEGTDYAGDNFEGFEPELATLGSQGYPILCMSGSEDITVRPKAVTKLAACLSEAAGSDVTYIELKDAGHMFIVEKEEDVAWKLMSFWEKAEKKALGREG